MEKVLRRKKCTAVVVEQYVEPPPIPLIKSNHDDKLDKDFVKLKLYRYPTSYNSYLYEFKMALFDKGELEEFLLFVHNFNMRLGPAQAVNLFYTRYHLSAH